MKYFAFLVTVAHAVSPMEKVFSMLSDLETKVVEDGKAAEQAYENYTKFCTRGKRDLGYDIQDGEKTVEELTASIDKSSSDIEVSSSKIQELQGAITKSEADLKAATDMRSKEQAEHKAAKIELEDATDMLGRAIKTLSEKLGGTALLQEPGSAANLVQALGAVVDAAAFPNHEKQSLMAFVESATAQPAVAAYQSKSGGILSTLEDMKEKARDDLTTLISEDKKAQHSYLMLKQSLEMQMAADQKEMDQAKALFAEASEAKATSEADLDGSSKDLANDKTSLQQLEASCSQADDDYQEATKSRSEELEALKKAQEVLKEKTGAAQAGVYGAAMFLQVKSSGAFEVVQKVRNLAKKAGSSNLENLASNIESLLQTRQGADVFAKVKDLIQNMITSRKEEAAADATKKAYCDEEQTKTKAKLEELTGTKESLSVKVDKKTSEAETLKSEAATLQRELADLSKLQIEMDKTRREESAAFKKQKADLEQGLEGVRSALSVLRDYYESGATSFLQQPALGHSKDTAASTGILGMLEVVESDFGRSLAQAETVEATKAEEYDTMTKQNKLTKVQKDADQKFKSKTAMALDKAVADLSSDTAANQEELAAVETYKESLAKQCADGGMSYAERAAKREEEIEGLKDALASLGGTDLNAVLLQSAGLRGAVVKPHVH
mmetsp:Transcript_3979/g.6567  ORF Transcript_3979/g.6567 Transcript_3979/m.6567 type:complete len:669 (+) Transcript_3979:60-2066(+)